jgi:hypothetical protein
MMTDGKDGKEIRLPGLAEEGPQEFTLSLCSRFEAQTLLNAICGAIESLKKDSLTARGRTLLEISKAVAALECLAGRLMDRL